MTPDNTEQLRPCSTFLQGMTADAMIYVKYFASIKDILDKKEERVSFLGSAIDFKHFIRLRYPELNDQVFLIAVNGEYVPDEEQIQSSDTVALIPPVCGG